MGCHLAKIVTVGLALCKSLRFSGSLCAANGTLSPVTTAAALSDLLVGGDLILQLGHVLNYSHLQSAHLQTRWHSVIRQQ